MITFKEYTNWNITEADAPAAAPPPDAGAAAPAGGAAPPDLGGAAAPPAGGPPPDMGGAGGGMDMGLGGSLGGGGEAGAAAQNTKLLASDVYDALEKYLNKLKQNKEQLQSGQQ